MSTDYNAQQPAPGQPGPGQPGQPGAMLPPPPNAQFAPQPRKKGFPKWLISVIVLLVIGGGFYAFNYFTNDAAQAKAGDCAKVSGTKSKPNYDSIGCDSADATHVVGKALSKTSESCGTNSNYDEFTLTGRGPDTKLCLMPKWNEGECRTYKEGTADYPKVDCGAAKGTDVIKVVKVVKGSTDVSQCPQENSAPAAFPEPPTVYCLAPVQS